MIKGKERRMKTKKSWFIILFCLMTFLLYSAHQRDNTLREKYKDGTVQFVPELTIDESMMPEDTFFESAVSIAVDEEGFVYICDFKANNIKKFDSSGKYVKTIGRMGQGPGEFNMPFEITVTGNRLIVWDMGNSRLCIHTTDGEFIKSIQVLRDEGWPQKMRSLPNGDVIIEIEKIYYGEGDKPQDCKIELYSSDLEKKKTLYTQQVMRNKYMRIESMFTNIIQPFTPLVCWDVSPDGKIIIGYPKEYDLGFYDTTKGKISSFSHNYKPVKVTEKDKENFFAGMTFSSGGTVKQGAPDHVLKYTEFPKFKPAFREIIVDSDGNILVWTYRNDINEGFKYFDLFDPNGQFIGNIHIIGDVSFPRRAIIRDGTFWQIKTDEEGLIKVIKYRISD
jgi:hypothetical protein